MNMKIGGRLFRFLMLVIASLYMGADVLQRWSDLGTTSDGLGIIGPSPSIGAILQLIVAFWCVTEALELAFDFIGAKKLAAGEVRPPVGESSASPTGVTPKQFDDITFSFDTSHPLYATVVGRLLSGLQADMSLFCVENSFAEPQIEVLECGQGSWWLRVGIPVATFGFTLVQFTSWLADKYEAGEASASLTEACWMIKASITTSMTVPIHGGRVLAINGPVAIAYCERHLPREQDHLPSDGADKQHGDVSKLPPGVTPPTFFRGRIVDPENPRIMSSDIASAPFRFIDMRASRPTLLEGVDYDFQAALQRDGGAVVAALVHHAKPIIPNE